MRAYWGRYYWLMPPNPEVGNANTGIVSLDQEPGAIAFRDHRRVLHVCSIECLQVEVGAVSMLLPH